MNVVSLRLHDASLIFIIMDLSGVPTPVLDWNSMNLLEHFKKFRGHSDLMFSGPLKDRDDSAKVSYLLLWMDEKGRDIYRTLVLTEEQRKSVKDICEAFERHVQPKSYPVFSRYKFHNEKRGERTTEAFITRLKTLSVECAYGPDYRDDLIRDQIVFGINSEKVRENLITEGAKLTVEKDIQICHC